MISKQIKYFSSCLLMSVIFLIGCSVTPETDVPSSGEVTNTQPLPWTVMVYMDGDNDLETYALQDLNEMENSSTASLLYNVVVLVDRVEGYTTADGDWTGTRLYKIAPDTDRYTVNSPRVASAGLGIDTANDIELDMSDTNVLKNFVEFCQTEYAADNYLLVIWNHGDGWKSADASAGDYKAICEDKTSGGVMFNFELADALRNAGPDVLGFDACLMGMAETVSEFADVADVMIASTEIEPGAGWPYSRWMIDFANSSGTVSDLYRSIIDAYAYEYSDLSTMTMSAIDLSQSAVLMSAIDGYAGELIAQTNEWQIQWDSQSTNLSESVHQRIIDLTESYNGGEHLDLWSLAHVINAGAASDTLKAAVESAVLYERHDSDYKPMAHGLAIYYGNIFDSDWWSYVGNYTNINRFNAESKWGDYLRVLTVYPPLEVITTNISYTNHFISGLTREYQFYIDGPSTVSIFLEVNEACNDNLYLYHTAQSAIADSVTFSSGADESITNYSLSEKGWYRIKVSRLSLYMSSIDYVLTVSQ